ncbi:beta-lactamase/transpeptidase-like protein [Epithele typhae]|uniref:beta-lactamase/transpeptidase-like protein n=1 Tax=Epithele typhae TaxID=378194 RepID=UPI0020080A86|nr:beta-lactamase/transpeptidase-like protein [Epithele typhae]KAH9941734.1 beta-lactamase/transpeptidase-like protein [Epithele typhae]
MWPLASTVWLTLLSYLRRDTPSVLESVSCRPFLPKVFVDAPPTASHPLIRDATQALDAYLATRFHSEAIDTLSVGAVTSNGVLYEHNFGVLRANETGSAPVDSHSMYRIASVSKMFTVLEGMILEQRGVLSWDDRVDKHLPEFKYTTRGLDPDQSYPSPDEEPITLAQLASHMSGMGRDWPPGTATDWPHSMTGGGPPPTNGLPFPSREAVMQDMPNHPFASVPWDQPIYSNVGIGVLGLALAEADRAASGRETALTHAELLKRDIFDPMGLNGSHFLSTDATKDKIVVGAEDSEYADMDFKNAMNPSGGQYTSLHDLMTIAQSLLNAKHPKSQLSPFSLRKWLRPMHAFEDNWTEVGLVWEIVKTHDSNGRARRLYQKMGNVASYHTAFTVNPTSGYGIVVMIGGSFSDSGELAYDAYEILQPAMDAALAEATADLYAGLWYAPSTNADLKDSYAIINMEEWNLYGEDALSKFGVQGPVVLRETRREEFRVDTGQAGRNGKRHVGCYVYWTILDEWGMRNNATVNAIYFTGSSNERRLHVPSLGVVMKRVSESEFRG